MKIAKELLYPAPFYNFLSYISESHVHGPMLDCGSGGPNPKQALFFNWDLILLALNFQKRD